MKSNSVHAIVSSSVTVTDFSPKFYCLHTANETHHLIPKTVIDLNNLCIETKFTNSSGYSNSNNSNDSGVKKSILKTSLFDMHFQISKLNMALFIVCMVLVCVGLWQMSVSLSVLLMSLVLHELGPVSIAYILKCKRLVFGWKLQYRFIPILYISNRDIYKCKYYSRILYYFGGVLVNFCIACICALGMVIVENSAYIYEVLRTSYIINLVLCVLNLYPLLFTDGFNIIRELTQLYDLRNVILQNIFHPQRIFAKGYKYALYYLFLIVTFVSLIARAILWLLELLF